MFDKLPKSGYVQKKPEDDHIQTNVESGESEDCGNDARNLSLIF